VEDQSQPEQARDLPDQRPPAVPVASAARRLRRLRQGRVIGQAVQPTPRALREQPLRELLDEAFRGGA
jgi:hypothetical protein